MVKPVLVAPVSKNQEIELPIHGLGHDGEGVGRYEGFAVFVPGALPGETVKAKIVKIQKSFAFGKLLEVRTASEHRIEPICPIYQRCGGCHLQHLAYPAQLEHKRQLVRDVMDRIAKLPHVPVHPTIGMKNPWEYRNKAQVPVGLLNGETVVGFFAPRTHDIIAMETCAIQHSDSDEVVRKVRDIARKLRIEPYQEAEHRGFLRHVVARTGFQSHETMLVLVTAQTKFPQSEQFVEEIRRQIPHVTSIVQNVNSERTNVIFGRKTRTLWGKDAITDRIGSIEFDISARSFFQVNPIQTEVLYAKALEYAKLSGNELVVDAYCGIGTISLFLSQKAKHVIGVEIVPEAIEDARHNAKKNGIENVEFLVGEAEKEIPKLIREKGIRPDVVVVDPPRKGCDPELLEAVAAAKPERIVYVSCNPATLARDLRYLEDNGYKTVEVQPVDMFPQTSHVECVTLLVRNGTFV